MNENADFGLRISERDVRLTGVGRFNPHSAIRTPNSMGFTLVEVLLAMAILAVVVTAVYASFSSAGASVEHAEAERDGTDLARTLLARMTNDLANAYCRMGMQGTFFHGRKVEQEVDGEPLRTDSLSLTTLTNWRRPGTKETALWEVGYFFQEAPEGGRSILMRRERRVLNREDQPAEEAAEYRLTDGVEALRLRYSLDGRTWTDELGGSASCVRPRAVELTVTLRSGKVYQTAIDVVKAQF